MMKLVVLQTFFTKLKSISLFFELTIMTPKRILQFAIVLIVNLLIASVSYSQCTIAESGTVDFDDMTCSETGSAPVAGVDIIIPAGVTLSSSGNNDNFGQHDIIIEDGGILFIDHNNVQLDGNLFVEDGGTLQINGKMELACGSGINVESGGLIITGSSSGASDKLSICSTTIIQGGGGCTVADGNPDSNPPYCAGGGGISGPTGFDETGEAPGTLPILLISFEATDLATGIRLDWATAIEERNAYFDLENSQDGQSYQSVTRIDGGGNTTSIQRYSHLDTNPYSGVSYYRLVQVDTDDKRTIYGPVRVDRTIVGELAVFPNPLMSGQKLNIRRATREAGMITISLMDLQGRVISDWQMNDATDMQLAIPETLNKGIYLLEVSGGGKKKLHRLVLQ